MSIQILMTVLWLSPAGHVVDKQEIYTNTMQYCKQQARLIMSGDGATSVQCKYVGKV